MPDNPFNPSRNKARILLEIDRKLPELPREQQNLVAAFAQGLLAGLALRVEEPGAGRAQPTQRTCKP